MENTLEVNKEYIKYGFDIIKEISEFRPYSSISFRLSEEVAKAISETRKLAVWGMGKNRRKMKLTVSKILGSIEACSPGEPVNLNLTEYEHKSIGALLKLMRTSIKNRKKGLLLIQD